ncbi:GntR family transcriptional regulator, partial [Nakamurella sp.]|uniref:GntR family transcriptional regulator n=1 Tax=Nakamurella sp. TaxID=1869182 RepID=UPI003B3AADC8
MSASAHSPDPLDRSGSTPLYVQLADVLRKQIERGVWQPDQKIPSENELNRMYGISRMTARQVLAQLVNEELLFRVQGKGTFVAHRKIGTRSPTYMGLREQLERMGYETSTRVLSGEVVAAPAPGARPPGRGAGAPVHRRVRVPVVADRSAPGPSGWSPAGPSRTCARLNLRPSASSRVGCSSQDSIASAVS